MPVKIPIVRVVDDASRFTQQVTLDGVNYTLRFDWNERDGFWYLVVLSEDGQSVCTPQSRIVVDYIQSKYMSQRQPPGFLIALDGAAAFGKGTPPGYDDLGNRVQLYYFSPGEL